MTGKILKREIHEQPQVVQKMIELESQHVKDITAALQDQFDYIMIAARGTSDNAARYAQYLLGARNQIPVALATPSLFTLYRKPPSLERALVMGISQSGRSPDIVSVIEEGQNQSRPTLAITNDPDSPLAAAATHVIQLHTGLEKAVAATKTYTSSLTALALLSAYLREDAEALAQLQTLPEALEETLIGSTQLLPRVERYRYMQHCTVIGRGFNYATAFEISLKIKELTRTVSEPYSSADFLHGPIAMLNKGFPTFIIAPLGAVFEDICTLLERVKEHNAEIILISNEPELLKRAHLAFPIPVDLPEWLTPMVAILPGQLFSLTLATIRGLDPDQPAGLTKVTETW